MTSVNDVHLVGFLAADPDITATAGGVPIANLGLVTVSHKSKDHQGKKRTKHTHHNVVCYGGNVARVKELKRGAWIQVLGYLDSHTKEDKHIHEVRVKTLNVMQDKAGD